MLIEAYAATSAAFLVGRFVYHRWFEDKPVRRIPAQEITIPIVERGLPMPLIYGRTRVRSPVLAWNGRARSAKGSVANGSPDAARIYMMDMLFTLGIPFNGGNSTNRIHNMWAGDRKFGFFPPLPGMSGIADLPLGVDDEGNVVQISHGGFVEFFDGNPNQVMDSSEIVQRILTGSTEPVTLNKISGRRGRLSVGLYGGPSRWIFGDSPTVPAYSFEVSSYDTAHPQLGTYARVGNDSNPVNVLVDLLKSRMGKLGIPESRLDISSFQGAQYTLHTETHGYSNCIDSAAEADEHIEDILRQIDGCIDEDPTDGRVKIKLIRNDYDPNAIFHITKDNCEALTTGAAGGWTNIINAVQVKYRNRAKDYAVDSERDQNQANAYTGEPNDLVIDFPGVTSAAQALNLAKREVAARSRPIIKFRAICNRSAYRLMRGEAVKVTWQKPNIPGLVFRVANVERGTLEDGKVALDLVSDVFYVWRNRAPLPPTDTIPTPEPPTTTHP